MREYEYNYTHTHIHVPLYCGRTVQSMAARAAYHRVPVDRKEKEETRKRKAKKGERACVTSQQFRCLQSLCQATGETMP